MTPDPMEALIAKWRSRGFLLMANELEALSLTLTADRRAREGVEAANLTLQRTYIGAVADWAEERAGLEWRVESAESARDEARRERDSLGTNMEMAQAQIRGWGDFFSGQPRDMPFTETGTYAKNSQLNFAWCVGYDTARESELWKLMVGRADRSAERSQACASELAATEIALTGAQVERDHFRVALGMVTTKYEELLTRSVRPENAPALQHAPTNEKD